jgi:hypothetical protein
MESEKRNEANILHPDVTVMVRGQSLKVAEVPIADGDIHVSEFNFGQVLQLEHKARELIDSVVEAVTSSDSQKFDWNRFIAAAAAHPDTLTEMLVVSTGETAERLNALSDSAGRSVLAAFFKINWDFFLDRLVAHAATATDILPPEPPDDAVTH